MKMGTLLTGLNNYGIEVTIQRSETLREVLCPAKQDSMLPKPYSILSSEGLKSEESSTMTRIGKNFVKGLGNKPGSRLEKLGYFNQGLFIYISRAEEKFGPSADKSEE